MFDTGQVFLWKYRAAKVVRIAAQANDGVQEAMENLLEHVFRNVLGVEQEDPGDFGRQLGKLGEVEDLPCLIADTMPLGQSVLDKAQLPPFPEMPFALAAARFLCHTPVDSRGRSRQAWRRLRLFLKGHV